MSYRTIELPEGPWTYTVGRRTTVIRDANNKRHIVNTNELVGMTPDNWDDYLANRGPGIGPQQIKDYINTHLYDKVDA